jgi:signal peptidase I
MKINKWILGVGAGLIATALLFKANHCVFVTGHSMDPTFHNMQILSYDPNSPITQNCVVVFNRNNETLIKRVAEVPGQFYNMHVEPDGRRWPEYLQEGEYFVEGDNQNSEDSWIYGVVTKDQILGVINNVPIPKSWNIQYYANHNKPQKSILKPTIKLVHNVSSYRAYVADDSEHN